MQPSDKEVYEWVLKQRRGDPRWAFGIAHFEGEDWLIGYRAELSFPMFKLEGCKSIELKFRNFLKSDKWKILVWLVGDHKERFEAAYERLERAGGDRGDGGTK